MGCETSKLKADSSKFATTKKSFFKLKLILRFSHEVVKLLELPKLLGSSMLDIFLSILMPRPN